MISVRIRHSKYGTPEDISPRDVKAVVNACWYFNNLFAIRASTLFRVACVRTLVICFSILSDCLVPPVQKNQYRKANSEHEQLQLKNRMLVFTKLQLKEQNVGVHDLTPEHNRNLVRSPIQSPTIFLCTCEIQNLCLTIFLYIPVVSWWDD